MAGITRFHDKLNEVTLAKEGRSWWICAKAKAGENRVSMFLSDELARDLCGKLCKAVWPDRTVLEECEGLRVELRAARDDRDEAEAQLGIAVTKHQDSLATMTAECYKAKADLVAADGGARLLREVDAVKRNVYGQLAVCEAERDGVKAAAIVQRDKAKADLARAIAINAKLTDERNILSNALKDIRKAAAVDIPC